MLDLIVNFDENRVKLFTWTLETNSWYKCVVNDVYTFFLNVLVDNLNF